MANYTIVVVTEISDLDDFALTVNSLIDPQRGGKRNLRWNGEPPKRFKSSQSCFVFRAGITNRNKEDANRFVGYLMAKYPQAKFIIFESDTYPELISF